MKKAIIYLFILFATLNSTIAQQDYNAALMKLENATTNEEKLKQYEIIFQHFAQNNIDSIAYFANKALDDFKKNNFIVGVSDINIRLASYNSHIGKIKLAEAQAQAGLDAARSINYLSAIGNAYNVLGVINAKKEKYTEANELVFKALNIYQNETKVDTNKIISTYIKLGLINSSLNLFDNARMYFDKGISLSNKIGSTYNLSHLYTNISVLFGRANILDSAEHYTNKSLEINKALNDQYSMLLNYNNLGNIEMQRGNVAKGIEYYNKALDIATKLGNIEESIRTKLNILEASQLSFQASLDTLNNLLEQVKKEQLNYFVQQILYVKMDLYEFNGYYKEAFKLLQEINNIEDSLEFLKDKKEIEEIYAIHEVEQAKAALLELQVLNEHEKEIRNAIVGFLILFFLAVIALLFVLKRKNDIHKKLQQREFELQKLNDSKNRLFSVLGHDLRGPIGNLMHLIELTNDKDCDTKNQYMEMLTELSASIYETLNNILEWGKSQLHGDKVTNETLNAYNETIACVRLYSDHLKRKKIDLITTIDATIDIYFDLNHYNIIIRNLLSNAIKFSSENGEIAIGTVPSADPAFITFFVKDSGVGMKSSKLETLFTDSWKSTTGTANEKGSGLGLLLCKNYIEQCGGKIWAESKLHDGSTFYFTIKKG